MLSLGLQVLTQVLIGCSNPKQETERLVPGNGELLRIMDLGVAGDETELVELSKRPILIDAEGRIVQQPPACPWYSEIFPEDS